MKKSDIVKEKARDMDWQTALAIVSRAVHLHASKTAADGQFSREAIDRANEIQAAWQRIQRG